MKLFLLFSFVAVAVSQRKRFDGCELWEIIPATEDDVRFLLQLYERHDNENQKELIFWEEPRRIDEQVHVLECSGTKKILEEFLTIYEITGKKLDVDVQQNLDAVWIRNEARHEFNTFDYDEEDFNTYEDIMAQLDVLEDNCPSGVTCTVDDIGPSYEGRPMKVFRISKEGENRQGIWMDSLIHAREWLAGTTNLGILTRLVTEYETNEEAKRLVDTYDWHILPVFNPDGYSYTWSNDRFWRKSRTPNQGSACSGTDLNRNHNYMWGTAGSSANPCSETYRGATSGSEVEVQAVEREGENLRGSLLLWITWHTYARYYLYPFGTQESNGNCIVADNAINMQRAGEAAIKAVQETYNEGNWVTGTFCDVLYAGSGTTQDWVYNAGLVRYSYTPELRGNGFNPDKSQITPSLEENWNGLVAMLNEIAAIEGSK